MRVGQFPSFHKGVWVFSLITAAMIMATTGCQNSGIPGLGEHPAAVADIQKRDFGHTTDGDAVEQYTLTSSTGASVSVITYGATVTNLVVPDKDGKLGDVILGYDNIQQYQRQSSPYFGATVGRVANRIANGEFKIGNNQYCVPINNGPNHLHGGVKGYDKRIWKAEPVMTTDGPTIRFSLTDPDGAEGYPGTVTTTVIFTLTNGKDDEGQYNGLKIQYFATTTGATPVNLTNHTYFNLNDGGKSQVLDHVVKFNADHYTPVDAKLIPTGEIAAVKGTPYDFTSPKPIGQDIAKTPGTPNGYDHNFALNSKDGSLSTAAEVYEASTGRLLKMMTTEPGVQFYTGNFLDGSITGKYGNVYQEHNAFCLEAQDYPDAVNHPTFPDSVVKPGEVYRQITEYRIFASPNAPW
jgi:aldose 1-epimerase